MDSADAGLEQARTAQEGLPSAHTKLRAVDPSVMPKEKQMLVRVSLVLFCLALTHPAMASRCIKTPLEVQVSSSTYIFTGFVQSGEYMPGPENNYRRIRYKVIPIEFLKGHIDESPIFIRTGNGEMSNDAHLSLGRNHLFFSNPHPSGEFHIGMCPLIRPYWDDQMRRKVAEVQQIICRDSERRK